MDLILLETATIIYTDPSSNVTSERSLNTSNSALYIYVVIYASIQTGLKGRSGFFGVNFALKKSSADWTVAKHELI